MPAVKRDPLLATHEGKALAQLEQELLQPGEKCLLQVGLMETVVLAESGEFEHERIFHQVRGLGNFVPFLSQRQDSGLVTAQGQSFKQK